MPERPVLVPGADGRGDAPCTPPISPANLEMCGGCLGVFRMRSSS